MKKITTPILGLFLMSLTLIACQSEKKAEPQPMESKTSAETTSVLNANLATEEDLKNADLEADLIASILSNRPFLSMNDFTNVLSEAVDQEALFQKVFVPFNLNTTTEADFKMIPGVGERMAHEFEEYKPYTSVKQFKREIGKYVDEAEVERYLHYVFVPVELNSATEEDILALPGVGKRMAHEFEEYRPYENMAQFRKEIGKYVDDAELKRLERFVYLK